MNINNLYIESIIFRWIWTAMSIVSIVILGQLDFVTYNWFIDEYSNVMGLIIWISFLTSIVLRFIKINIIKVGLLILSDLTLIIVINRGIVDGNYFKKLPDTYLHSVGILIMASSIALILDWIFRIQLLNNKRKNCIQH